MGKYDTAIGSLLDLAYFPHRRFKAQAIVDDARQFAVVVQLASDGIRREDHGAAFQIQNQA